MTSFHAGPLHIWLNHFTSQPHILLDIWVGGNREYRWAPHVNITVCGYSGTFFLGLGRYQ